MTDSKQIAWSRVLELHYSDDLVERGIGITKLGNWKTEEAFHLLMLVLEEEVDEGLRTSALRSLGRLREKRAVDRLVIELFEGTQVAQLYAVQALGEIGDERATEPLVSLNQASDAFLREYVAKALGKMPNMRAVRTLEALLNDEVDMVRLCALASLDKTI